MALFGLFSKNKGTRCTKCNSTIKEGQERFYNGNPYCSFCYERITADSPRGGHSGSGSYGSGSYGSGQNSSYGSNSSSSYGRSDNCPASIQSIKTAFDKLEAMKTPCQLVHLGDQWELIAGVSGKANSYQIKFICKDSPGSAVAMRVFSLAQFNAGQVHKVYPLLGKLQNTYRYLRFTLDSDNSVKLEYDFPAGCKDLGGSAVEILLRTMSIVDDVYPELMKCAWG